MYTINKNFKLTFMGPKNKKSTATKRKFSEAYEIPKNNPSPPTETQFYYPLNNYARSIIFFDESGKIIQKNFFWLKKTYYKADYINLTKNWSKRLLVSKRQFISGIFWIRHAMRLEIFGTFAKNLIKL